jgi:hypothetical protein
MSPLPSNRPFDVRSHSILPASELIVTIPYTSRATHAIEMVTEPALADPQPKGQMP